MTPFMPRDHQGNLLDLAGGPRGNPPDPARRPRGPALQLTLGQVMAGVAAIAVLLAIAIQNSGWRALIALGLVILLLAIAIGRIARLPLRARLLIELATAGLLLFLSAWIWRPAFDLDLADRAETSARLCSTLAGRTDDPRLYDQLRQEANQFQWASHRLRVRALWRGLRRFVTREAAIPMDEPDLLLDIRVREATLDHAQTARMLGIPFDPPYPGVW